MRLFVLLLLATLCEAQVVPYVEALVLHGRLADAQVLTSRYRNQYGTTPEALAAMSWLARGEFNIHEYDKAMSDADELQRLVKASLSLQKLDSNPFLPLALGASYEVQAQCLVALNRRSEAVQLLQNAERDFKATSILPRLKKNVLLLTLVGHPLPTVQGIAKHGTASAWSGKPVLFFFWAHWCPDCKAMGPVIARLAAAFEPRGLVVVAPTRLYGYTAEQENVSPADEKRVLDQVFQRFYASIPNVLVPVDASNFEGFGASTTPTLVLADRQGIVRLYHPGGMPEEALRAAIAALIP